MASEKVLGLIESVKSLTVLELSELVKELEEKFGVSAAAPWLSPLLRRRRRCPRGRGEDRFDVSLPTPAQQGEMGVITDCVRKCSRPGLNGSGRTG
jgi:large subunit ribosomal protein L7/L12